MDKRVGYHKNGPFILLEAAKTSLSEQPKDLFVAQFAQQADPFYLSTSASEWLKKGDFALMYDQTAPTQDNPQPDRIYFARDVSNQTMAVIGDPKVQEHKILIFSQIDPDSVKITFDKERGHVVMTGKPVELETNFYRMQEQEIEDHWKRVWEEMDGAETEVEME